MKLAVEEADIIAFSVCSQVNFVEKNFSGTSVAFSQIVLPSLRYVSGGWESQPVLIAIKLHQREEEAHRQTVGKKKHTQLCLLHMRWTASANVMIAAAATHQSRPSQRGAASSSNSNKLALLFHLSCLLFLPASGYLLKVLLWAYKKICGLTYSPLNIEPSFRFGLPQSLQIAAATAAAIVYQGWWINQQHKQQQQQNRIL